VSIDGYKSITTQIFDRSVSRPNKSWKAHRIDDVSSESKYLEDDSVFAVKDALVVKFVPRKDDPNAQFDLKYDVALAPLGESGASSAPEAHAAY
jgi:catechol 1,2-dioxygenase